MMNSDFDRQKMLETLVNPDVSVILVELEGGEKDSNYLVEKLGISANEIRERLEYVTKHEFVTVTDDENKTIYKADMDKLNKIMESDENFSNIVDGLTELDQYLN